MSGVVKHRSFRDIERLVNNANDAGLGLLVGGRIARLDLSGLPTSQAKKQLSELFTEQQVEDSSRFDFYIPTAIEKLRAAERELCVMAVPFAVSLYNEYLVVAAQLLELAHISRAAEDPKRIFLGKLERYLHECGVYVGDEWGALVRFIRAVRNSIIHSGGRVGDEMLARESKLPPQAHTAWSKVTGRPIPLAGQGEPIPWEGPEIRGVFLVIRRAVARINERLQQVLPREFWADLLIHELWVDGHQNAPPSKSGTSLLTTAKAYGYGPLNFGAGELKAAVARSRSTGWRPDLQPYWQRTIPADAPVCQAVTATDLLKGRIRIPAGAADWFPSARELVQVKLREKDLAVDYRPSRTEAGAVRSGVLEVGVSLAEMVTRGQALSIFRVSNSEVGLQ